MPKFQFQFKFLFKNNLKTLTKISDEHKKNWMIEPLKVKASQSSSVSCKEAQEFKLIFKLYLIKKLMIIKNNKGKARKSKGRHISF
jgi:hypothetical protein